ncbi:MAG: outer membrane protein assembly factor [Imperialibacter sp.]|uniref:BamA/OMP85 family outer membrane protein n=1 Tax=Imperialibacter sp. TaxID=2038411 RepID=UPI0030DDBEC7|tara:strand:- start:1218 stop:3899 length:2682 start_codon:yes stop_codon:yes gene_type:complete
MKKIVIVFAASLLCIVQSVDAQIRPGLRSTPATSGSGLQLDYSNPKEYEIGGIEVTGSEYLDKNAIISISGLSVGSTIKVPGDATSGAIKKLWNQGILGDVSLFVSKIEGNQIFLTIELKERPRLTKFTFEGLNKTQKSDIEDDIKLIKGRVVTDAVIKNTELTIKKYFQGKGYLNADVKVVQQKDTLLSNSVMLKIVVDKKYKVKVNDIKFTGNDVFLDSKLKSKMKNTGERLRFTLIEDLIGRSLRVFQPKEVKEFVTSTKPFGWREFRSYLHDNVKINVFKTKKFLQPKYEEDKKSLITYFNAQGYRDAEIVADSTVKSGKGLDVYITVDPGQKYYFGDITWSGNYVYDNETLDKVLAIKRGDVYDMELVKKKLTFNPQGADISSLYMDNGYLFFDIKPVEVKINGDSIDVEMRLSEGSQATLDKIYVTGNDRTNDHVIIRELRTLPGQKFSRNDVIRTQRELAQLGYFNPETVTPNVLPNIAKETADIEWQVEERPSDQIELSGGWGGPIGFVGTLGVTFNNFSLRKIPYPKTWSPLPVGDGQKLSVRFQANGKRFQTYSVSFSEPWLGGRKPNSFGLSYSYSIQRQYLYTTSEPPLGTLGVQGITASLGRRVTWPDDYFTVSNSLSYLKYDLNNYGAGFTSTQSLGFTDGVANSLTFNTTIARNSVDQPMYPRSGSNISLTASFTPPYSAIRGEGISDLPPNEKYKWVEYHKWMFDSWYYLKLVGNLVLVNRVHFGVIGSYDKDSPGTPFERFSLGGSGLAGQNFILATDIIGLRGYADNSLRTYDQVNNITGGVIYNKFVFELRYPVSLSPTATIYLLTFAEGGNNWNVLKDYNPYNLYKSVGAGVRVFMPAFGLLGVDYGYGFDTIPGQTSRSGGQFHFSIGQQIR